MKGMSKDRDSNKKTKKQADSRKQKRETMSQNANLSIFFLLFIFRLDIFSCDSCTFTDEKSKIIE